ncbi:MAG: GNAT family N-acetyltransferase [Proteobacteria bacterium]|nr:GNAT family N-acetyltransferase [Pseudomonadota bacterium]
MKRLSVKVDLDEITKKVCEPFDYKFNGESTFDLPEFDPPKRDGSWSIGLIVGPSGSGKTQLLEGAYGINNQSHWDRNKSIASHFENSESAIKKLTSVGLNSIPAWCKPFHVLSNGEQFRASLARSLNSNIAVDEFTSVVDRSVAKSCSNAIQKFIRRENMTGVVFSSCHYDIIEWLQPDWCYDTMSGAMLPRGCLQCRPPIRITIEPCSGYWWKIFKHHHYLTSEINMASEMFIAKWEDTPVGFVSALPMPSGTLKNAWRGHRTVVLPDYQGLGIGVRLSDWMGERCLTFGRRYFSKTCHPRMGEYRDKSPLWRPTTKNHKIRSVSNGKNKNLLGMNNTIRDNKLCYSHEYIGDRFGKN